MFACINPKTVDPVLADIPANPVLEYVGDSVAFSFKIKQRHATVVISCREPANLLGSVVSSANVTSCVKIRRVLEEKSTIGVRSECRSIERVRSGCKSVNSNVYHEVHSPVVDCIGEGFKVGSFTKMGVESGRVRCPIALQRNIITDCQETQVVKFFGNLRGKLRHTQYYLRC